MLEDKIKGNRRKISEEEVKDDVIKDYDSIIRESSLLTTVCGILFGFLLNISINTPKGFTAEDSIILVVALYSISFAVSFFTMPVVYHHLQYPYSCCIDHATHSAVQLQFLHDRLRPKLGHIIR